MCKAKYVKNGISKIKALNLITCSLILKVYNMFSKQRFVTTAHRAGFSLLVSINVIRHVWVGACMHDCVNVCGLNGQPNG